MNCKNENTKQCLIRGYFAGNFGDDLILQTLCARYPKVAFYAFTESGDLLPKLPNLRAVRTFKSFPGPVIEKHFLRKMTAQIYVGGSVFQQNPWWKENADWFEKRLTLPTFVLGASFGPCKTPALSARYAPMFARCADIAFRDEASAALFPDCAPVRASCDLAEYAALPSGVTAGNDAVVSVIADNNPSSAYDLSLYESGMIALCKSLSRKGFRICPVSFCKREGDLAMCQRIAAQCENAPVVSYEGDIGRILKLFAGAGLIVGTRFHALLLAAMLGKPTIPIIYHAKQTDYFDLRECGTVASVSADRTPVMLIPRRKNAKCENLFARLDELLSGV